MIPDTETYSPLYAMNFSDLCCYEDFLMRIDLMGKKHNDKEILDSLPKCNGHRYIVSGGEVVWINHNGEKVDNPGITYIPVHAFEYCSDIQKVVIPNGVTVIGESAFKYCTGLTSLTIPNSVTSIGNSAFSRCIGLKSVTIPNSVTIIGFDAFSFCNDIESVTVPSSVMFIGDSAFFGCNNLKSVKVPNGCKIGSFSFPTLCDVQYY